MKAAAVLAGLCVGRAFYLTGGPLEYQEGALVDLKVNKLTSFKTQLPYGYYTLPYCEPSVIHNSVENIGEILAGDYIQSSPYSIRMLENVECKILCKVQLQQHHADAFRSMIDDEYLVNWIVDNLPAAMRYHSTGGMLETYRNGFPVGFKSDGRYFVHNHVTLNLEYHADPELYEGYRIVGFVVEPRNVRTEMYLDESGHFADRCEGELWSLGVGDVHQEMVYTYDVRWSESERPWSSRWDNYLQTSHGQINLFAVLNSLFVVVLLSGAVVLIMLRTLYRDHMKDHHDDPATAEAAPATGWKAVHGDIFRPPAHAMLLAVSVGSGVQILGMSVVTLIFALLGTPSPAHRGSLLQFLLLVFNLMGVPAGYTSAHLYKVFNGNDWKKATLLMAFLYPGIVFAVFLLLNLLLWGLRSTGAAPFSTILTLVGLWFGVSVPLVFLGAYLGFRGPPVELPTAMSEVPRRIPAQRWFAWPVMTCLVAGTLPFGCVFVEFLFIMSSMWLNQFYYSFGFLAVTMVLLLVTCAAVSVLVTYCQLGYEDYRWWWRSFFASGSSGFYMLLYSISYFNFRLNIEQLGSTLLYSGYMLIVSAIFSLLTGSVGTLASFFFVKVIYSSVKTD